LTSVAGEQDQGIRGYRTTLAYGETRASAEPLTRLERRVLTRARCGDQDAIHFLYVRHASEVRAQVHRVVGNELVADRITDDVFGALDRLIERYGVPEQRFSTWLAAVATKAGIGHLRSQGAPVDDGAGARADLARR
jgi:DNA-directed RNA polymerase specialized sigma24 family protein